MSESNYSTEDRVSMRVYLQRMEVRLSTIHRIAGLFLNGAGLLFLLPVLLRDTVRDISQVVIREIMPTILYFTGQSSNSDLSVWAFLAYIAISFPFLISVLLPIYALYMLFKDIIQFYFSGHHASFPDGPFIPRFSLSALAFPRDESPIVKRDVMRLEYTPEYERFTIPFDSKEKKYFEELHSKSNEAVSPTTRKIEQMERDGVFDEAHPRPHDAEIRSLNTALGLAGLIDSTLVEQVAKMELSLTRHLLHLRRIVLRYVKSLILFVSTTFASFVMASFATNEVMPQPLYLLILSVGYLVWAVATQIFIRKPIEWIWLLSDRNTAKEDVNIDLQITEFEKLVLRWTRVSIAISTITTIVGIALIVSEFYV